MFTRGPSRSAMFTMLLVSLFAASAAAASCPSAPLPATQLYLAPNLTSWSYEPVGDTFTINVVLPDTLDHNRSNVNIRFVPYNASATLLYTPKTWDLSNFTSSECQLAYQWQTAWSDLVGHAGELRIDTEPEYLYYFRIAVSWSEMIQYGDNNTHIYTKLRNLTSNLELRARVRRHYNLTSYEELLDNRLFWAMMTRRAYDADTKSLYIELETRVGDDVRARLANYTFVPFTQPGSATPDVSGVVCAQVGDAVKKGIKWSQTWSCIVNLNGCVLSGDIISFHYQLVYNGSQPISGPLDYSFNMTFPAYESYCPYDVGDRGAYGVQVISKTANFEAATTNTAFWPGQTLYAKATIQSLDPVTVSDASIYSVILGGSSIIGSSSTNSMNQLVYNKSYSLPEAKFSFNCSGPAPTASSAGATCYFQILLDASFVDQQGELIVSATFDVVLNGVKRSVETKTLMLSSTARMVPASSSQNVPSGNAMVFAIIGAMVATIAAVAVFVVAITIYRRRQAARAQSASYAELSVNTSSEKSANAVERVAQLVGEAQRGCGGR